jgi:hypothetical protein
MSEFSVRYEEILCEEVCGRLIRNPNYGGQSVALNGWRYRDSISNHTKAGFQAALRADIAEHGVRNPILVWCLPEGTFLTFGGSRLKACRNLAIERIPAIVNDYTGAYEQSLEVRPDNWESFFTDPPRTFEFGEFGADYHYNLERARRHEHDEAGFAWLNGEQPNFIAQEFPWLVPQD